MELKMLPHTGAAYEEQEILFGGVNYGPAGGAGELAESRNLSAREYPCLSQRQGRRLLPEWEGAEAIYDWFGKLIVCRGGTLYIDEKAVAEVTPGPKQFAVVNTQLIVWPDRIAVSLTEERVIADGRVVKTAEADGGVVVTETSVTAPLDILQGERTNGFGGVNNERHFTIYTYGNDREAFKACWDEAAGTWDEARLLELKELKAVHSGYSTGLTGVEVGDIVRLDEIGDMVIGEFYEGRLPDTSQYSATDHYGVVTETEWEIRDSYYGEIHFSVYRVSVYNPPLFQVLAAGDRAAVSGGPFDLIGADAALIKSVDAGENCIVFADTLRIPVIYCANPTTVVLQPWEVYLLRYGFVDENGESMTRDGRFSTSETVPEGCVLYAREEDTTPITFTYDGDQVYDEQGDPMEDEDGNPVYEQVTEILGRIPHSVRFWDPENRVEYGPYSVRSAEETEEAEAQAAKEPDFLAEDIPKALSVTLRLALPEMDYICGHENRLWGVSNKTRTVYASELGKPFSFYEDYDISTGAWAVPVGSDGDFTGCIGYGANVLFWKEDRLHKLLGSSPEDFTIYEYAQRGVEEGSAGSMVILNEVLYFKTREGIAAFAGGVPQMISGGFGLRRFRDAVGGTDGERYYVSMQDLSDGEWGVWVYDPKLGIWLQEREGRDAGYAMRLGEFYTLTDGSVYATYATDAFEADGEWSATFCEITETVHGRKKYSRLKLRYVLDPGAELKAEIRCDGGEWKTLAFHKNTDGRRTAVLPIRPNRCDRVQIRLSGRGYCRVESLVRRFRVGGDG